MIRTLSLGAWLALSTAPSGCALMLPVAVVGSVVTSHVETAPPKEQADAPWYGPSERAQKAYRVTFDVVVRPGWWPGDYRWRLRGRDRVVWWSQIVAALDSYADRTGAAKRRWWPYDAYVPCLDPLVVVLVARADRTVFFPSVSTIIKGDGALFWCDPARDERPRAVELDTDGRPFIATTWGRLILVPRAGGWCVESSGSPRAEPASDGFLAAPRPEKSDPDMALIPPC